MGGKSDLDFFLLCGNGQRPTRIAELEIFSSLIRLNRELKYPPFSNDGDFLRIYSIRDLVEKTGRPIDDSDNSFTARMLLLLESEWIANDATYRESVKEVVENYFRDKKGKRGFKPLFLLNDLLRYWRTLCLNYEQKRSDGSRKWRKKNINLKFSRMLTVFSTVLHMLASKADSPDAILEIVARPPLERFAMGVDLLDDTDLPGRFGQILDSYELFLSLKEKEDADIDRLLEHGGEMRKQLNDAADQFSEFFYSALTHGCIARDLQRFLVI